jgi:hypothetical protein
MYGSNGWASEHVFLSITYAVHVGLKCIYMSVPFPVDRVTGAGMETQTGLSASESRRVHIGTRDHCALADQPISSGSLSTGCL